MKQSIIGKLHNWWHLKTHRQRVGWYFFWFYKLRLKIKERNRAGMMKCLFGHHLFPTYGPKFLKSGYIDSRCVRCGKYTWEV